MQHHRAERFVAMAIGIVILVAISIAGFGKAVHVLWNLLMPPIFGLPTIGFWQAVGLMALSWILFGGLRGFGMIGRGRGGRWSHLTPEERERFRRGIDRTVPRADAEVGI